MCSASWCAATGATTVSGEVAGRSSRSSLYSSGQVAESGSCGSLLGCVLGLPGAWIRATADPRRPGRRRVDQDLDDAVDRAPSSRVPSSSPRRRRTARPPALLRRLRRRTATTVPGMGLRDLGVAVLPVVGPRRFFAVPTSIGQAVAVDEHQICRSPSAARQMRAQAVDRHARCRRRSLPRRSDGVPPSTRLTVGGPGVAGDGDCRSVRSPDRNAEPGGARSPIRQPPAPSTDRRRPASATASASVARRRRRSASSGASVGASTRRAMRSIRPVSRRPGDTSGSASRTRRKATLVVHPEHGGLRPAPRRGAPAPARRSAAWAMTLASIGS